MKKQILLMGLFISFIPLTLVGQKNFYNLDFENSDTTGKTIISWQNESRGTEFSIDNSTAASGKKCLFINVPHPDRTGGGLYYFTLPQRYNKDLRSIEISVSIYTRESVALLACSVKKNKELLGCDATYFDNKKNNGTQNFNIGFYCPTMHETKFAPTPYTWTNHSFSIKVDKDPTMVKIYLSVPEDRAWFDNIVIKINGQPLDLIFDM